MKLISQDIKFEIEDSYVEYSPLLHQMLKTDIPVEMQEGHIKMDEICNPEALQEYLNFLQGKDFNMNDNTSVVFDLMGHSNQLQLNLEQWKIMIQDRWIRDNMYKYKLYEDPYYGLVKLPIVNVLKGTNVRSDNIYLSEVTYGETMPYSQPEGTVIAGSAALWMAGGISKFGDVDHFFVCDKQRAENIISQLKEPSQTVHTVNTAYYQVTGHNYWMTSFSYVLRLYKAPTEVVHGFDVDCCGVLFDANYINEDGTKGTLFATRRAAYAIQHKINIFNPERASPSYAYRLIKYMKRGGYKIHLPLLDEDRIQKDLVTDMCRRIAQYAMDHELDAGWENIYGYYDDTGSMVETIMQMNEKLEFVWDLFEQKPTHSQKRKLIEYLLCGNFQDNYRNIYAILSCIIWQYGKLEILDIIGMRDPASILILAQYFSFYTCVAPISDYDSESLKKKLKTETSWDPIDISKISWIEQDPMQQVSSTIYPTPIQDLESWYETSPLYK